MYPYVSKPKLDKKIDIPANLIKELLTPSEIRMIKQRYLISNLLDESLSVRVIAAQIGVGTDTVVRVAKLRKINAEVKEEMVKNTGKGTPKWVFGKADSE
jgi:Trp operon repressor